MKKMKTPRESVIVDELLHASLSEAWEAITDPVHMKRWYFDNMPDFKPETGFTTSFIMKSGGKIFTARWKVTEVVPGKKIVCEWSYKEYSGTGIVTFILSPEKEKTRITVINEGLETFPQDIPEFTKESCFAGWEFFIRNNLPKYLENNAPATGG